MRNFFKRRQPAATEPRPTTTYDTREIKPAAPVVCHYCGSANTHVESVHDLGARGKVQHYRCGRCFGQFHVVAL